MYRIPRQIDNFLEKMKVVPILITTFTCILVSINRVNKIVHFHLVGNSRRGKMYSSFVAAFLDGKILFHWSFAAAMLNNKKLLYSSFVGVCQQFHRDILQPSWTVKLFHGGLTGVFAGVLWQPSIRASMMVAINSLQKA